MEIKGILTEALNGIQRARDIAPKSSLGLSALRWELYAILQNTLDAMAMIVADLGLRKPPSYADLGRVLREAALLNKNYSDMASTVASVRNTLAHAYRRMRGEDLSAVVRDVLPKVEKLIGKLLELMGRRGIDPSEESPLTAGKLADVFAKHGVTLAYLFGSRARGTARENSDYDMAVLFESDEATILDEVGLAMESARALGVPSDRVDVVALNKADTGLMARVFKEGIAVYSRSEGEKRIWERDAYLNMLRRRDLDAVYVTRTIRKAGLLGSRCGMYGKPSRS